MSTARHINRMDTHIGPRIVTMEYIDRVLDQAMVEYHRAINVDDVEAGQEALRRCIVLRARARREIERYRQQNGRAGEQIPEPDRASEESHEAAPNVTERGR